MLVGILLHAPFSYTCPRSYSYSAPMPSLTISAKIAHATMTATDLRAIISVHSRSLVCINSFLGSILYMYYNLAEPERSLVWQLVSSVILSLVSYGYGLALSLYMLERPAVAALRHRKDSSQALLKHKDKVDFLMH